MRLFASIATLIASSSLALASTNTWETWQPVTTTVTMTLLHVTNETVTSTSYSHSSTPIVSANLTSSYKATATPTSEATIASFSTGAAVPQQVNFAVAGLLGVGAVAYGLF